MIFTAGMTIETRGDDLLCGALVKVAKDGYATLWDARVDKGVSVGRVLYSSMGVVTVQLTESMQVDEEESEEDRIIRVIENKGW